MTRQKWWTIGWVCWTAFFFVYEGIAVLDSRDWSSPLTEVILTYVPWWAAALPLLWIPVHFALRYINRGRNWPI